MAKPVTSGVHSCLMKMLYDMFPLAVFFVAMVVWDLKIATAAIIVATVIQNAIFYARHKRFERMHLITMFAVIILGGVTLLLDDVRFIKWKPTVVNWVFTVLMLGTQWFTQKPALERVMGGQIKMPSHAWNKLNTSWAIFFAFVGVVNLYFAFWFATPADPFGGILGVEPVDSDTQNRYWGYFKVFGIMGMTLIFAVVSMMAISRHIEIEDPEDAADEDKTRDAKTQKEELP